MLPVLATQLRPVRKLTITLCGELMPASSVAEGLLATGLENTIRRLLLESAT